MRGGLPQGTDTEGMSDASIPTGRGWYPDPFKKGEVLRLFDGARWTDQTRPIPEGYDATQADASPKKETPPPKAAGKNSTNETPTDAPALKTPNKQQGGKKPKPAKNGTAPMFTTPTAKAETSSKDDKPKEEPPAKQQEPGKAPAAPAFATPAAKAEKPKGGAPNFAPPTQEAPEPATEPSAPAAGFTFAKPANGSTPEPPATAPEPEPAPQAVAQSSEPAPRADIGGMPEPDTSDYVPEEDSDTVNSAFAAAPEPADEDWEEEQRPTKGGGGRFSLDGLRDLFGNARIITWAATVVVAIAALVLPSLLPSPVRGVAAECEPITEVVVAYDQASDFTITPEAQAELAGAVSTGKLDDELTSLVTTAVDEDDLEPVVERCLPQEDA